MSKQPPGIMTPDKYLQTDEQTLLEIAPHWRLLQVFPREPRRIGYDCGAMFYIGTEGSTGTGKPDMAGLLYGGPCLEETALALSALIPLMPGANLLVLMVRNTKSQEGHDTQVIWQASRSHDTIKAIRNTDELDDLLEYVGLRVGDQVANVSPYFVLPYSISNKRTSGIGWANTQSPGATCAGCWHTSWSASSCCATCEAFCYDHLERTDYPAAVQPRLRSRLDNSR